MRLLSHRVADGDRLAVVTKDDRVIDVADLLGDGPWTMSRLLSAVDPALAAIRTALERDVSWPHRSLGEVEPRPPIDRPGKIVGVGRNYHEHAAEEGVQAPQDPVLFAKFSSAVVGDGADIVWRVGDTAQVDYEAELAVVIGRTARDLAVESALDVVLGYACLNDVSARDLQFGDGQWVRGKSLDTFCPFGPWIVTKEDVPDPGSLRIRCVVNGQTLQDANTSEMVHGVAELLVFCSRFMTLEPGDVIATGTPGGVGVFREPPRFLADADEVIVEIDRIGGLTNRCRVV